MMDGDSWGEKIPQKSWVNSCSTRSVLLFSESNTMTDNKLVYISGRSYRIGLRIPYTSTHSWINCGKTKCNIKTLYLMPYIGKFEFSLLLSVLLNNTRYLIMLRKSLRENNSVWLAAAARLVEPHGLFSCGLNSVWLCEQLCTANYDCFRHTSESTCSIQMIHMLYSTTHVFFSSAKVTFLPVTRSTWASLQIILEPEMCQL